MGNDGGEMFHRSEGYYFGTGEVGTGGQDFGSVGDYIDVGQCKRAGHFAEEDGLLVIGFDQRQVDARGPQFQGDGGESGTGADVEDAGSAGGVPFGKLRAGFRLRPAHRFALGLAALSVTSLCELGRRSEEVAGQEERFAEMAGYNFFRMADGGQIDVGVPAE